MPASRRHRARGCPRGLGVPRPSGGFAGSVDLAVGGLPAGATASFSPASTAGTSTLSVQTARNAKPGTSTLTITGTSGTLTRTATATLQIKKK